jgi:perosamine synthetase
VQIGRLDTIIARRRQLAAAYAERLGHIAGVRIPAEPEWARSNWQSYAVALEPGFEQYAVMQALLDRGVSTRRGVMNAHLEPAYQQCRSYIAGSDLERSVAAQQRAIMLPLFVQMTEDELDYVADSLADVLSQKAVAA